MLPILLPCIAGIVVIACAAEKPSTRAPLVTPSATAHAPAPLASTPIASAGEPVLLGLPIDLAAQDPHLLVAVASYVAGHSWLYAGVCRSHASARPASGEACAVAFAYQDDAIKVRVLSPVSVPRAVVFVTFLRQSGGWNAISEEWRRW